MNSSERKRLDFLDICKGILIACLCFCHYVQALKMNGIDGTDNTIVWKLHSLYNFYFMQAFFIITGYCTNFEKDLNAFLKSIFHQLVLPAMTFEVISDSILFLFFNRNISQIIEKGDLFWFLWCLALCKIVYYFLLRINRNSHLITIGGLILVPIGVWCYNHNTIINFLHWKNVCVMFFFLHIGYVLKQTLSTDKCLWKYFSLIFSFLFIAILSDVLLRGTSYPHSSANIAITSIREIPIYIISATLGSFGIIGLSYYIGKCRFLQSIGGGSLIIYGFHFLILSMIVRLITEYVNITEVGTFIYAILFFVSCTLTLLLSWLLSIFIKEHRNIAFLFGA